MLSAGGCTVLQCHLPQRPPKGTWSPLAGWSRDAAPLLHGEQRDVSQVPCLGDSRATVSTAGYNQPPAQLGGPVGPGEGGRSPIHHSPPNSCVFSHAFGHLSRSGLYPPNPTPHPPAPAS